MRLHHKHMRLQLLQLGLEPAWNAVMSRPDSRSVMSVLGSGPVVSHYTCDPPPHRTHNSSDTDPSKENALVEPLKASCMHTEAQ